MSQLSQIKDQVMICTSLLTVDCCLVPCLNTSTQLQHKMKQKVEASLVEKIAFTGEMELLQTTDKLLYSWPQSIQQPATL